jgi:hypothetical protein
VAVGGRTDIDTSDGEDDVVILSAEFSVAPAPTETTLADVHIELGQQVDFLLIGDFLGLELGVTIGGDLDVETREGDDEIHLLFATVLGSTQLETSDGKDCVEIRNSIFADLDVNLGHGNDHLLIADTTIAGAIDLNGSGGTDTFYDDGGNTPPDLTPFLRSFEELGDQLAFPCAYEPEDV